MGNCLSTCTKSPSSDQGPETTELAEKPAATTAESPVVGEVEDRVRLLVQQELHALQEQISHSQAVLAKLHFHFHDGSTPQLQTDLAKVHRTTQTSNPDTLPKSLECVSAGVSADWRQITSSCPAIVNTAVQTDDETTSKSNNTSGEYFLPPISPVGSQPSEPVSPKEDEISSKPFEPRPVGHIDLDIYRSCRKLSVLPEEEGVPEEVSPPVAGTRLAPTPHYPHQAHSFESYLLPVSPNSAVRRQLSDPTPSPEIHPVSRRSSRSTCRPLQLQQDNYFRFPDVQPEQQAPKSPPSVTFNDATESSDDFPRITSPTYNILQDTVSQLITMSSESLDDPVEAKETYMKASLTIPSYYSCTPDGSTPYKTPPENSLINTPGFFTPQETYEKKPDSSTSSSFQTPTSLSPGTNGILSDSNKSTSNSSQSYRNPGDLMSERTSYQSSFSSPIHMSPLMRKRANKNNENAFTDVPDLNKIRTNGKLFVKPLPGDFDPNRTMLSILLDEPRVQADNSADAVDVSSSSFISFTSLDIQKPSAAPEQVPSLSVSPSDVCLTPGTEGLARTPSRRRLQRSLVRISSETPLEFVPVIASSTDPSAETSSGPSPLPLAPDGVFHVSTAADEMADKTVTEDTPKMRRTNSDNGSGGLVAVGALPSSHSFPSLSDTVLRQLGALMEEVKLQKEEAPNSEKDIENKFTSLMLAFKTDKLTLERRLELQRRLRDQAEQNMANELTHLKAAVQLLSPLCTDSEKIELLEKVSEQVDALHKCTSRVSTSAEMYGAVQQENRLSKAVDIVLRHVENLKQAYDKEKTDHEETRKVLSENKSPRNAVLKLQSSKRRASIATLTRAQPSSDPGRSPTLPLEGRPVSRVRLGSLPRKLSNTILEAEQEDVTQHPPSAVYGGSGGQPQEVVESSNAQAPIRTLQRKPSRPTAVLEERRVSHSGETESEDESSVQEPLPEMVDQLSSPVVSPNHQIPRRVSMQMSWMSKLSEQLEWVQPMDQLMLHLRYSVAVALLIAALAVFTSTFILPHTRLGSDS